jgi:hypothetical protein
METQPNVSDTVSAFIIRVDVMSGTTAHCIRAQLATENCRMDAMLLFNIPQKNYINKSAILCNHPYITSGPFYKCRSHLRILRDRQAVITNCKKN